MSNCRFVLFSMIMLLISSGLLAKPDFKESKENQLKRLDGQISLMSANKACIQKAQSEDDLKGCREVERKKRRDFQESMKKEREAQILKRVEEACKSLKMRTNKREVNLASCKEKGLQQHKQRMKRRRGGEMRGDRRGGRRRGRGKGRGRRRGRGERDFENDEPPLYD